LAGVVGGAIVVVSQLSTLVFDLGSSVRESFNKAVSESVVVFNDLKQIAMTTFGAVSDALAAGDMELAMKAAMEGVVAAFARGAGALMSKVDGLSADILNTLDAFATFAANPTLGLQMALGENPAILAKDPTLKALNARQDARLGKVTESQSASGRPEGAGHRSPCRCEAGREGSWSADVDGPEEDRCHEARCGCCRRAGCHDACWRRRP
jgi:hypothetical protein